MNYNQQNRINRVFKQKFFLIDTINRENTFSFIISGSTANLYTVEINLDQSDLESIIVCDCRDSTSWAKRKGVKCKHCCFVIIKVLNILKYQEILDDGIYYLNPQKYRKLIADGCYNLHVKQELININYSLKYQTIKNQPQKSSDKYILTKEVDQDDDCPICFDSLHPNDSNQCPTCHNIVHTKCIKKWLQLGNKNCVYCRSDWSDFINPKNSSYLNVA